MKRNEQRQCFVVIVNITWLHKCVCQLPPPKPSRNFRFCSYRTHFNRLWISGMTELRSQTSNWNTLISWHLKHTNLHFEWGYLQQNRYYLLAFSSTSHGSVTYSLIANDLPNKHAGSSSPRGNTTSHRKMDAIHLASRFLALISRRTSRTNFSKWLTQSSKAHKQ